MERGSLGFVVGGSLSLCGVVEPAHGTALQDDAMRVVEEAIKDRIPERGISHDFMPVVDGDLASEEGAPAAVAVIQNLKEIVAGGIVQRSQSPVVEDE